MASRAEKLRTIITEDYLATKPSFERCRSRAAKAGIVDLTRDEYSALKGRAPGQYRRDPHDVRSLEDLYAWTSTEAKDYQLERVRINAWSPDHTQVRADLTPKREPPPLPQQREIVCRHDASDRRLRTLVIPDTHIGHHAVGGRLEALHDELALEIVHRVAEHLLMA